MNTPPKLDSRTASDIVDELVVLLETYTTGPIVGGTPYYAFPPWREYDSTLKPTGVSAALIGVFARFAELVIERLNQVPDKNLRAFLDLLGAARLPPEPARVPLTFSLAAGRTEEAVVPAGTKVAATPAEGESEPVVFEVERPLVVTAAQLSSLVTLDPEQDTYTDSSSAGLAPPSPFRVFQGEHANEHVLYLGDNRLLAYSSIKSLQVVLYLAEEADPFVEYRAVEWQYWNGTTWVTMWPSPDPSGSENLTQSGTLSFGPIQSLPEGLVHTRTNRWIRARLRTPITPSDEVRDGMVRAATLPALEDITLVVLVERSLDSGEGLTPDMGFTNGSPLDLTKELYPFGERPKPFDTFYLSSREGFFKDPTSTFDTDRAEVQVDVTVVNPHVDKTESSVKPSESLELVWECSTRDGWTEVGRSHGPKVLGEREDAPPPDRNGFSDGTFGFCQDGRVRFRLPDNVATTTVNGQENHWLRVRLAKGDYGLDSRYVEVRDPAGGVSSYKLVLADFHPPIISSFEIGYQFVAKRTPEICLTYNDLTYKDVTAPLVSPGQTIEPFKSGLDLRRPGLFLGFSLPARKTAFPNNTINLYASLAAPRYGERLAPLSPDVTTGTGLPGSTVTHRFFVTNTAATSQVFIPTVFGGRWTSDCPAALVLEAGEEKEFEVTVFVPVDAFSGEEDRGFLWIRVMRPLTDDSPETVFSAILVTVASQSPSLESPRLVWQYWNGRSWNKLAVLDGSDGFNRSGLVEFVAPRDLTQVSLFGRERYWLRVLWEQGEYSVQPRLQQLLLNTTTAVQSLTTLNEILGSSTGSKSQTFRSTRFPVLEGQRLEVREPELPSEDEQANLRREEGNDALEVVFDAAGRPRDIWVRWHEVPDFYGSGPRDRHYVMDHLTGEIRFGDGVGGRIPPIGASNLRLARYQSGRGSAGNRAAGTVTQLKTAVPYIEKVTNPEAAAGGADAEPLEVLYERMPRTLRHRDRAVAVEDYEDLAALASPEVARSACVPLRDLAADQLGATPSHGMVSVIIVPRTSDAKPQPTLELLQRVRSFLEERAPAEAGLSVVGPLYVRVDVRTEVAVSSVGDARAVERAVQERLATFLHPLTGGLNGKGWDFGRAPHRSDFMALIEGVPGVDHVRFLRIDETEDLPGVQRTGRFLVYSGKHQIDLAFEET